MSKPLYKINHLSLLIAAKTRDEPPFASVPAKIRELCDELKVHAQEVEDPKCAALCETSVEVMGGLETAFNHFLQKSEKAWQD